ncbi:MAG: hypothetical protein JNK46_14590 [Methylobacteriaceae bacterium]|nr:hypothetical protein [Methylobacteriaceae bacterium]
MRISMQHFERRPQHASPMHGFTDLVFEDRSDTLRIVLQIVVACCIGVLLGTVGQGYLRF